MKLFVSSPDFILKHITEKDKKFIGEHLKPVSRIVAKAFHRLSLEEEDMNDKNK